jgi:predicted nucleotidyltransferase
MKKTIVQKYEQSFNIFNNTHKVMRIFFLYPTKEFTLTDVANATGLSKGAVSRIISDLRKRDFVHIVEMGNIYRIRAGLDGSCYKNEKLAFNLGNALRSNLVDVLLKKFRHPISIILFGSYRKAEDDCGSDIDIAVEMPQGEKTGIFEFEELKALEKMAERKVAVHAFTRKEVNADLFSNIVNGIVLYGYLEASK